MSFESVSSLPEVSSQQVRGRPYKVAGVQSLRSTGRSLGHRLSLTGYMEQGLPLPGPCPFQRPGQPRGVWFGKQSTCFYELKKKVTVTEPPQTSCLCTS